MSRAMATMITIIVEVLAIAMAVASICAGMWAWICVSMCYFVTVTILLGAGYCWWLKGTERKNNAKSEQKGIDKSE